MVETIVLKVFLSFILGFVLGFIFAKLSMKRDGRLIIDKGDYYVAITTEPSKLEKKNYIHLKVMTKQGRAR